MTMNSNSRFEIAAILCSLILRVYDWLQGAGRFAELAAPNHLTTEVMSAQANNNHCAGIDRSLSQFNR